MGVVVVVVKWKSDLAPSHSFWVLRLPGGRGEGRGGWESQNQEEKNSFTSLLLLTGSQLNGAHFTLKKDTSNTRRVSQGGEGGKGPEA